MGQFSVRALLAPDYKRELDITTLPNSIATPEAVLQRLDLVK